MSPPGREPDEPDPEEPRPTGHATYSPDRRPSALDLGQSRRKIPDGSRTALPAGGEELRRLHGVTDEESYRRGVVPPARGEPDEAAGRRADSEHDPVQVRAAPVPAEDGGDPVPPPPRRAAEDPEIANAAEEADPTGSEIETLKALTGGDGRRLLDAIRSVRMSKNSENEKQPAERERRMKKLERSFRRIVRAVKDDASKRTDAVIAARAAKLAQIAARSAETAAETALDEANDARLKADAARAELRTALEAVLKAFVLVTATAATACLLALAAYLLVLLAPFMPAGPVPLFLAAP